MRRTLIYPILLAALSGAAFADAGDPPARVARLNYIGGPVSFRPGNVEEWAAATLNYPLTIGDHLWADEGAGAELHIGSAAVRLASQTALELLNLDDRVAQLSVPQGGLDVRLVALEPGETFEIDTPNGAINLLRPGQYRIDVTPNDNSTYVTVRNGEAEVSGVGNPFPVRAGEMIRIGGDPASAETMAARPPDGWEQWCMDRDRIEDQAAAVSAPYVPRDMIGSEDLASNGVWREEAEYGIVWAPRVSLGWAPYHYGHWAYVEPWGWTWIDDAAWGFAPFHYGRWALAGGTWVWIPGARMGRPVYAPALVVFVGSGPTVGWFPLGPREPYIPAYRVSAVYVQRVNITHVNVTNINVVNVRYVNREVPGAVMAVNQRTFVSARPVSQAAVVMSREEIGRAQIVHTAPLAPGREARLGRAPSGMVAQPPARIVNRGVVARTPPSAGTSSGVRQIGPAERNYPARINAGQPTVTAPAPRTVERPASPERPAIVDRPARPANVERPATPAPRREVQPEPRQEQRPARDERHSERTKSENKKERRQEEK